MPSDDQVRNSMILLFRDALAERMFNLAPIYAKSAIRLGRIKGSLHHDETYR